MNHPVILRALVLAGLIGCLAASAPGITVTVSSTDQGAGVDTPTLQAGCTYLFEVSGTYGYGHDDWADAEFLQYTLNNHSADPIEVHPNSQFSLDNDVLDLLINGAAVDWLGGPTWTPHTYSPDHVYRFYFVGQGASAHLGIADWKPLFPEDYTGDNSGSLEVTISCVPDGGASLMLLGISLTGLACWRRKR
jgi:hypothetical protein